MEFVILHEKNNNHFAFLTLTAVGGRRPLPLTISVQSLQEISARCASAVRGGEKSSIIANTKSTTAFSTTTS